MTDAGWRRIGALSFRRRMTLTAVTAGPVAFFLTYQGATLISALLVEQPYWLRIVMALTGAAVLDVIVVTIAALGYRGLQITADASRVRIGRVAFPVAELDRASTGDPTGRSPAVTQILRVGRHGGRSVPLWLNDRRGPLLTADERDLLIRALEASSVRPPHDGHDPTGRFARYNFPGSLTRAEAIDLVRASGQPSRRTERV